MTFLNIQGLAKHFDDFVAVKDMNLSVNKGEFVSLLGPSGCGKTTTLQMIAGFLEPTKGKVFVNNKDITNIRPEKRGMGIVFQSYALFPHMTVEQNIGFGLEMRGVSSSDRKKQVSEVLELVQLRGLDGRYPSELSGGQRQRVATARALAIKPEVLLLDEPMSNLDAKLREEMHVELRMIQKHLGITTILVTHDQVEAMTMSDRIAVMHGGKIVQLATPYEAYENPVSPFASSFLGKTNSFQGITKNNDDGITNIGLDKGITLQALQSNIALNEKIIFSIRPEKIKIQDQGSGKLDGIVKTCLFLGANWMLDIDTALGNFRVSLSNTGQVAPSEGVKVSLNWQVENVRILLIKEYV